MNQDQRLHRVLKSSTVALLLLLGSPALAHNRSGDVQGLVPTDEGLLPDPKCGENGDPEACTCPADVDPVSPFTGRWFYRHVDLEVPGVFPIRLVRRYDSGTTYQSALGAGWAFSHDIRLFEDREGEILVRSACGQVHRYSASQASPQVEASGWRQTLSSDSAGSYTLTDPQGTKRLFDTDGRMVTVRDPQGNELRFVYSDEKFDLTGTSIFSVDPETPLTVARQFRLLRIEEVRGSCSGDAEAPPETPVCRHITFTYNTTTGHLETAITHDGRQVTYVQDADTGNLETVTLQTGAMPQIGIVQDFEYNSPTFPHAVTLFRDGQGRRAIENEYCDQGVSGCDASKEKGRLVAQYLESTGSGRQEIARITYSPTAGSFDAKSGDFTANGNNCDSSQPPALPCRVVTETIRNSGTDAPIGTQRKTRYKFRADGLPLEIIDGEGHLTLHLYDGTRPYLDRTELYRFNGASQARTLEKEIEFEFDSEGNLLSRAVEVVTAASTAETVEEEFEYEDGWVSSNTRRRLVSGSPVGNVFHTKFTFWRGGLKPGDSGYGADPIENIYEVKRLAIAPSTFESTQLFYNADGRLERVVLPDGHEIVRTYYTDNARDGLVHEIYHQESSTPDDHLKQTLDYDAQGRISSLKDGLDQQTTFVWDAFGRLEEMTNAKGETTVFSYGSAGPTPGAVGRELIQIERGKTVSLSGKISNLYYDNRGTLARITRLDGSEVDFATFTNDSTGRRLLEPIRKPLLIAG